MQNIVVLLTLPRIQGPGGPCIRVVTTRYEEGGMTTTSSTPVLTTPSTTREQLERIEKEVGLMVFKENYV